MRERGRPRPRRRARRNARPAGSGSRARRRARPAAPTIEPTSISNGSGVSGGRKPASRGTSPASTSSPAAQAEKPSRSNASPSSARTTGSVSASSGSTSTPPGAASIRTSRPPTTRCSPPSCQRFARSSPKARKRSVVSAKSNGCGTGRNATPRTLAMGHRRSGGPSLLGGLAVASGLLRQLVEARRRLVERGVARARGGRAGRAARSVEPALHLLRKRLHPRVDLLEPRDPLVGVRARVLRRGGRRRRRRGRRGCAARLLDLRDQRLEVRVELLEPLLDLLREVEAGLRDAARVAAAMPREPEPGQLEPQAQDLEALPRAAAGRCVVCVGVVWPPVGGGVPPLSANAAGTAARARAIRARGMSRFIVVGSFRASRGGSSFGSHRGRTR